MKEFNDLFKTSWRKEKGLDSLSNVRYSFTAGELERCQMQATDSM